MYLVSKTKPNTKLEECKQYLNILPSCRQKTITLPITQRINSPPNSHESVTRLYYNQIIPLLNSVVNIKHCLKRVLGGDF